MQLIVKKKLILDDESTLHLPVLFLFCTIQFSNAQNLLDHEKGSIQYIYIESGIVSSEGCLRRIKRKVCGSFSCQWDFSL